MRNLHAALVFLCLIAFPVAHGLAADAEEILARSKQAAGGEAWDAISSSHVSGTLETGGLSGVFDAWNGLLSGRGTSRYSLGPISGAQGFDGKVLWSQDSSGQVRLEQGGEEREAEANEAYRRCLAFWYPERWPATVELVREARDGERSLHVLRITPQGGRPYELWIDKATMLVDRTVEKGALETRTVSFSDYREVNGVKVAFASRSSNGEIRYDQMVTLEAIEFNPSFDEAVFAVPAPPPPDFTLAAGKTATTVPFQLVNNHIYVDVKINGKGPYRLLCDTGGANIVTPELAAELELATEGTIQGRGVGEKSEDISLSTVEALQVGDATLEDQVFFVFPLGPFAEVEGVPQFGLIGYEVFKRFVVRVDYESSLLTLTLPSAFSYQGDGTVVPFKFNNHIPQVDGEIDGIPGKFDVDTGSRSSLTLLAPFAETHGLKAHYGATVEATTGWGVGGPARGLVTRAKLLKLGEVEITNPVTQLSLQRKGSFTDPYVAGNVGGGVLKRFNLIFDYTRQQMIFERNPNDRQRDLYDRSGMWINHKDGAFEVLDVVKDGPAAAAGLEVGDRILAIDGQTPVELALPNARLKLRNQAPGTELTLTVDSGHGARELVLILRDLV